VGLWGATRSGGGRRKEAASDPDEKSGCGGGSGGVIWLPDIYRRAHSEKERKGGLCLSGVRWRARHEREVRE
jgi:hypothetical protein